MLIDPKEILDFFLLQSYPHHLRRRALMFLRRRALFLRSIVGLGYLLWLLAFFLANVSNESNDSKQVVNVVWHWSYLLFQACIYFTAGETGQTCVEPKGMWTLNLKDDPDCKAHFELFKNANLLQAAFMIMLFLQAEYIIAMQTYRCFLS